MSPSVGGWDEPKVTSLYVSVFSWVAFDILLDFTVDATIHFYLPIKGGGVRRHFHASYL